MHGFPVFVDGLHSWTSPGFRISGFDHVFLDMFSSKFQCGCPCFGGLLFLETEGCEYHGHSECSDYSKESKGRNCELAMLSKL